MKNKLLILVLLFVGTQSPAIESGTITCTTFTENEEGIESQETFKIELTESYILTYDNEGELEDLMVLNQGWISKKDGDGYVSSYKAEKNQNSLTILNSEAPFDSEKNSPINLEKYPHGQSTLTEASDNSLLLKVQYRVPSKDESMEFFYACKRKTEEQTCH